MRAAFKAVEQRQAGGRARADDRARRAALPHLQRAHGRVPVHVESSAGSRRRQAAEEIARSGSRPARSTSSSARTGSVKDVKFQGPGPGDHRRGAAVRRRAQGAAQALRATVDVLTMTATPIPRTLHMSLLGIRDISNLETPPPDRRRSRPQVIRWDDQLIRHAILRELNREGQVYFVHNRVHDIQRSPTNQQIVPEARIVIGHGQMPEHELEKAMVKFVRHEATSWSARRSSRAGLDIPNANTIFINEADRYGLADLHQLRGRVGRLQAPGVLLPAAARDRRSPQRRPSGSRRSRSSPNWAPASRSPCATWRSAGRATSSARAERPHRGGRLRDVLPVAGERGAGAEGPPRRDRETITAGRCRP
jgi:hypothetical protein